MPSLRPLLAILYGVFLLVPAPAQAAEGATARLAALFEREWQRDLADDPLLATYRGDTRYDDRWPELTPTALKARDAANARVLSDLAAISREV